MGYSSPMTSLRLDQYTGLPCSNKFLDVSFSEPFSMLFIIFINDNRVRLIKNKEHFEILLLAYDNL